MKDYGLWKLELYIDDTIVETNHFNLSSEPDLDKDGAPDTIDDCPTDPLKTKPEVCGCHQEETDFDNDGIVDCDDGPPAAPTGLGFAPKL